MKEVRLIRDKGTGLNRGYCFVEFFSTEDATNVLNTITNLVIDGAHVRLQYSRDEEDKRAIAKAQAMGGANGRPSRPAHISDAFMWHQRAQKWHDASSGYFFDPITQLYSTGEGDRAEFYRWDPMTGHYQRVDERGVVIVDQVQAEQQAEQLRLQEQEEAAKQLEIMRAAEAKVKAEAAKAAPRWVSSYTNFSVFST